MKTIEALLSDLSEFDRKRAREQIEKTPCGEYRIGCWDGCVPDSICKVWHRLPLEAKAVAYVMALREAHIDPIED